MNNQRKSNADKSRRSRISGICRLGCMQHYGHPWCLHPCRQVHRRQKPFNRKSQLIKCLILRSLRMYLYLYSHAHVVFKSRLSRSSGFLGVVAYMANQRLNLLHLLCLGPVGDDWYHYEGYDWVPSAAGQGWRLSRRLVVTMLLAI